MRNGRPFIQTSLSISAVLDFITLVQQNASLNTLDDHMRQHNIPPGAIRQVLSQQSIAQPMFLSNTVTVDTGFGQPVISFSLDRISSLLEFQQCMADAARHMLEDRFKAMGSAKFMKGEFLLQDENEHILNLRLPWKSIMKPGQRRYLSVKFRETATTACPHCGTDNELFEGQNTICRTCQVTYQRIVELGSEEDVEQGTAVSRHEVYGPRAEDITEDELKLCFHRVTLYLEQSPVYIQSYQQDPITTNYRPTLRARRDTITWVRRLFPHLKGKRIFGGVAGLTDAGAAKNNFPAVYHVFFTLTTTF
ncbi:unnamed protein product [Alternaria alternata]